MIYDINIYTHTYICVCVCFFAHTPFLKVYASQSPFGGSLNGSFPWLSQTLSFSAVEKLRIGPRSIEFRSSEESKIKSGEFDVAGSHPKALGLMHRSRAKPAGRAVPSTNLRTRSQRHLGTTHYRELAALCPHGETSLFFFFLFLLPIMMGTGFILVACPLVGPYCGYFFFFFSLPFSSLCS